MVQKQRDYWKGRLEEGTYQRDSFTQKIAIVWTELLLLGSPRSQRENQARVNA